MHDQYDPSAVSVISGVIRDILTAELARSIGPILGSIVGMRKIRVMNPGGWSENILWSVRFDPDGSVCRSYLYDIRRNDPVVENNVTLFGRGLEDSGMVPPLVLDIDGTLTRPDVPDPDGSIDPRVFDPIRNWDAPVVLATGKAFPYPIALCHFIGIEYLVIAETGGVICARDILKIDGDLHSARSVVAALESYGYESNREAVDFMNRWRETEVAVHRDAPEPLLRELAATHGMEVVDSGYAYHVKSPNVSKGKGLTVIAELLGYEPTDFVAIGDSINDVPLFELVGESYAVANASDQAITAADHVTDGREADGLIEVLTAINKSE